MSIESRSARKINDLIEIARDGGKFYLDAFKDVKDAQLSALFLEIAATKEEIVTRLTHVVSVSGERPAEHGTIVGSMQEFYGKVRATLGDTQYGYVAELEEAEDRLLKEFQDTVNYPELTVAAKQEVIALLPTVQETHAVMRDRKRAMKEAE